MNNFNRNWIDSRFTDEQLEYIKSIWKRENIGLSNQAIDLILRNNEFDLSVGEWNIEDLLEFCKMDFNIKEFHYYKTGLAKTITK